MKQKKVFSKKFHKKYVFLQNSLVHFLNWRVSEFSNFMTLTTYNDQTKSLFIESNKNSFHFLEQEKICFQDYWKNSEHKKLENAIQNMNKESITSKNSVDFQNFFNFSKKTNVFNIQNKFQLSSEQNAVHKQKVANQPSKLVIAAKKRKKRLFFVDNKKTLISFSSKKLGKQLQQKKYSKVLEKSQFFNFNALETFLPKSDIFRKRNLFCGNQKIGEFFPKKKNFTQYWVFPLLGFVVFFHSTPTFFNARLKQIFEKSSSLSLNSNSLNDHKQLQISQNSLTFVPIFSKFSSSFFPISKVHQKKNFSLEKKWKQQNFDSILDFSYTNAFSKETYHQIKNLENDEFIKYCDFSLKIFQNSLLFDLLNSSTNTEKKEIQSLFYFSNQNSSKKNIYRKLIETKRNTFHWKWFSLNSQFLNFPILFQQKEKTSYFSLFKIPQKAHFFHPIFENTSLFDFSKLENRIFYDLSNSSTLDLSPQISQKLFTSPQKSIFSQTPLLNFSKTMFLFNEFERNFHNIFHKNFLKKKENFKLLNEIVSLSEAKTENSNFHLLKTWNNSFLKFSKSSSFFEKNCLQKYTTNSLNSEKQNFFFFTKWLETQNFWKVTKNASSSNSLSSNIKKISMNKNLQNSLKIPQKFRNIENFMNLDFIYFRKFFSSLSVSKEHVNKKTLKTLNTLSNFSQFLKEIKNKKTFPHNEKTVLNRIVYTKKNPYSFVLKKRTFEFVTFQHYKHNSKKFINRFLSSSNRGYQEENKMKHKDFVKGFPQQNSQNLLPIITNKLHQKSLMKYENTNEKMILKNFQNFSKINCLSIPIYLNYSNKKSFEKFDIHSEKQNKGVSQNQMTSLYLNSISKYENLEARPNNLSSIYFHLLNNKKVSLQNFFNSKSFFQSKIDFVQTIYEKTLTNIKKKKFFSFSTLQLESLTFQHNFLFEKIKKEKPFIFENHENFSPLVFYSTSLKTKQSLLKSSKFFVLKEKPSFFISNKSKSLFCSRNKFFGDFQQKTTDAGQSESQGLIRQSTKLSTATKKQFFKNSFQNFQSRKYEKIFKTFLTPLNKENVSSFFLTNTSKKRNFQELSSFDKKMTKTRNQEKKRKIFPKFKTSKDTVILQTLSTSVQENFMNSNSLYFLSYHRTAQFPQKNISTATKNLSFERKNNTNNKFENRIQSNLVSALLKENHQLKTYEKSKNQNLKKPLTARTINVLYPSFILKRDGFVFFPSSVHFHALQKQQKTVSLEKTANMKFSTFDEKISSKQFFTEKQQVHWQPVHQKLLSQPTMLTTTAKKTSSFDFPIERIKETNFLTLKRLEQEKSLQKKRRMKKQKLETRRRKKRKRFFPRPIWLRFHFYKKFLKTRHPYSWPSFSRFLENEKDKNIIVSKNVSLPKNIFVLFPIKSKYQNIKAFSQKKTNFFVFHFSNTKKWENILYSSFFKKTLLQNKVDASKTFETKNIFVNKNSDQNFSTILKFFKKNNFSNIYKKKKNSLYKDLFKNHNEFIGNKIYRKNKQNWGFSWKKSFLASSEKHFYKKFKSNINFYNQTNILKKLSPISQNLEHYKISGEILSEFVRLSWKSYWFLTNYQPYTKRITQNLKKMQKIESEKNFSNFLTILSNKKSPMLFQSLPIFENHFSYNSQDFLLRNSVFRKFAWYFNIKNSLEENGVLGNSLNSLNQKSLNYQNIQNFPEYNRILYSRISEILRNFKSLENTDDQFMYMRDQKNLNQKPKRKNEIISSNSSFFTKNALFFENFHIPSQPSIPAFSIFSSIFHDFSIKPTGEIPTLRSLWALHQTNIYHFQEKNAIRYLWTLKKRTDNLKSFKGTKKAVHFFRKYSGLEKLNSPRLLNKFTSKSSFFNSMKKDEFSQKENFRRDLGIYPLVKKSNFFIFENLTNKKKFFVSNLKSGFYDFIQQLDILSVQKFLNSQQKCSLFGVHTIQQNSKMSLRYLKFHLFSNISKQHFLKSSETRNKIFNNFDSSNRQNIGQLENSFVFKNKDLNQQNSSKSSLNFWWSQKNFTGFDFFMNSQTTRLNSLQFIPFFSLEKSSFDLSQKILSQHTENFALIKKNNFFANSNFPFFQIEFHDTKKNQFFSLQTQILWFGAILFHLALFFTILKLPEIRSVLKFQCILFSKFFAGFFFVLFSLYNFFKKYTKKGTFVAKKILLKTSAFVKKNKSFDEFSFDLEHSSEFQDSIFSRNKNFQKKNLINLLFYFEDSQKSSFLHLKNSFTSNKSYFSNTQWSNKNLFFELFLRLSKFSSFFSKDQYLKNYQKYQNFNFFFISIHNFYNFKNFSSLEKTFSAIAEKTAGKPTSRQLNETKQATCQPLIGKLATNAKSFLKISKHRVVPKTQKFPMTFFKNSKSIFYFQNSTKQFPNKNFINRENSTDNEFLLSFYSYVQTHFTTLPIELKTLYSQLNRNEFSKQKFLLNKNKKQKILNNNRTTAMNSSTNKFFEENKKLSINLRTSSQISQQNWQSLQKNFKNLQTLSKNEKFLCQLALSFLFFGKSTTIFTSKIVQFSTNVSSRIFDFIETIMFSIYKFLEKPAEVFIEWIAFIFLIEWSSDIATFVPDTLDISLTKSFQKLNRPARSGSFFLNFLNSRYENLFLSFYAYYGSNFPASLTNFFGFWSYVNLTSFIVQKRMFYFFENFCSTIIQPDMDLLTRQRKGIIFWDIWAEILLKAAEKYNVNIPSFVTLKEEQELFIEKLLQDKEFLKNLQNQTQQYQKVFYLNKKVAMSNKQQRKILNGENIEQNSLSLFIENFLEKERFQQFYEFSSPIENKSVNKNQQNIEQLAISKFLFSQIFESDLSNGSNSVFEKLFSSKILLQKTDKQPLFLDSFSTSGADFSSLTKFDRSSTYGGNQSGTYQGPETDLFIDIHPPKSLKHIQFSKYYEPAQYTLGSLICQVYSGLFSKQISKNILVIGAPGTAKTLFIQALAGETEMKMITDNAYRYSMVLRGVAVGMKYLRDVFDALALQTPCFFLMEHIHVLGAKRPFLISDDENIKGIQTNVGLEQQEVHETNQMIYQLNRHSIVDYKRPYKGDFSMGIPTNFFVQSFYSNSENNSNSIFLSAGPTEITKNSIFSAGTVNAQNRNPISPLPIDSIEHSLLKQGFAEKEKTDNAFQNGENSQKQTSFQSRLQRTQEQIFAPPATSPFTILMMKEQKKLKPKKIVQENSWGGLSTDQLVSYQKESSSVRAKVALLADITMNLSRGKLDMITDLLVIIDSVRSNRGFVVFATTHLPSLLDPALRRPGRFDETISLAQSPNFLNRFEIFKTNFQNSLTTLDFLDSSIFTENLSEMNLLNFITRTKLSFFHQYKYTSFEKNSFEKKFENKKLSANFKTLQPLQKIEKLKFIRKGNKQEQRLISQIYPTKALHNFLKSSFFYDFYCKKSKISYQNSKQHLNSQASKYFLRNFKLLKYTILPKAPSHILNFAYSKIGTFLAQSNLLQDPTAFTPLSLDTNSSFAHGTNKNRQYLGNILYDSQKQQKLQFMIFLSGKIAEFCLQKNTLNSFQKFDTLSSTFSSNDKLSSKNHLKNFNLFQKKFENENKSLKAINTLNKPSSLFHHKFSLFPTSLNWQNENKSIDSVDLNQRKNSKSILLNLLKNKSQTSCLFVSKSASSQPDFDQLAKSKFSLNRTNTHQQKTDFYWTTFGNDQIWRFLTPFLFSIIQKRFLFTKNLLLSKMLFFENKNTRKLPPNPPSSSILMPSKKFENFKRTETDFVQKSRFSINEKIQMHQQQRFLKQLYNIPIQQYFRSEMIENRTTLFSSSFQELAYLDSLTRRFSSSHFYQRKYLIIRHRFSNTNQWWNGLLPEHNTETTYLSDVDWRTMFANPTSKQKSSYLLKSSQNISQPETEQKTFSLPLVEKDVNAKHLGNMFADQSTTLTTVPQEQYVLFEKDKNQTFEFIMDFPDPEQYYNPRNRRWYLNNNFHLQFSSSLKTSSFVNDKKKLHSVWSLPFERKAEMQSRKNALLNKAYMTKNVSINAIDISKNSSYWLTFDKTLQYEIYYHYLMQSFHETFYYFNTHREMLDLFVFQLLRKGFLKELDYLMTVSRF